MQVNRRTGWIEYLNDLKHLNSCDFAVSVQVVHVKGPVEFLFEGASWCDGQGTDELSEVDGAVSILVEGSESMLSKLWRITIREKLKKRKTIQLINGNF